MEIGTENETIGIHKELFYFVMASLCTLPFVLALGSLGLLPGNEDIFGSELGSYLFCMPTVLSLTVLDLLFILFAWLWSPAHFRFILPFYILFVLTYWICVSELGMVWSQNLW